MFDKTMTEEVLQFGGNTPMMGILTLPRESPDHLSEPLVFVLLNAGFLHRAGPRRLYVRLARTLAEVGFSTLRVDLTGRGDSSGRAELRNEHTLMADCQKIVSALEARLGPTKLVLGGLCSGADNAIALVQYEPRVVGMFLIDPTCYPDSGFKLRQFFRKYLDIPRIIAHLKQRISGKKLLSEQPQDYDNLTIGVLPTQKQLRCAFQAICERKGRALSVFTSGQEHYNKVGQLARILELPDYDQYCVERYFSTASHTFDIEKHRRLLLNEIKTWSSGFFSCHKE